MKHLMTARYSMKLHPFVKSELYDDFEHIRPFPDNYETYDFLNATDMFVTDYSSIMFDYAVSGKKIALFTLLTGRNILRTGECT